MKRILTYLLVAIVIIGIIVAAIFFLTRSGSQTSNQEGQTGSLPSANLNGGAFNQNTSSSLPGGDLLNNGNASAPAHGLSIVSDEPTIDYFVDNQKNVTLIEPDGKIATITNNNVTILSSSEIKNIISTGFSYDGIKVFVNFGDMKNPQTSVFDIKTKLWVPLPVGMISPQWSPTDYRIIYLRNNSDGTETLATSDASKAKNNIVSVITLHIQDASLLWLSKNKIIFYDNPSIYTYGSVWSFDLQKKSISPIITEQRGLETAWSNTTTTIGLEFVGGASQYGGRLQLVNGSGNVLEQLGFLTLPSKCLFSQFSPVSPAPNIALATTTKSASSTTASSTASSSYLALYCGVPRDQNALSSSRLPDNYEEMALFTSDNIYRINTSNGAVETLFNDQTQNMDTVHMKIFDNSLFFLNRYDQKLYSVPLE